MARGRMINATVAEDEDFNSMSIDAQFMFMRTLPHLDRDGLITGNSALLWSKIAPLLPEYNAKMSGIIQEWITSGFVIGYVDGKRDVLFFINFRKNQTGMRYEKETPSQFAPPPKYKRTQNGLTPTDGGSNSSPSVNQAGTNGKQGTELVRTYDVFSPCELEVEEEVEEEVKGKCDARACASATQAPPPSNSSDDLQSGNTPNDTDSSQAQLGASPAELERQQTLTIMAAWDKNKPKPVRVRMSQAQAALAAGEPSPAELPSVRPADPLPTTVQPGHVVSTPSGKVIIDDVTWLQMLSIVIDGLGYRELVNAGVARVRSEAVGTLETLAKMPAFRT